MDKIIDTVAPVTDTDQEQRDEILRQKGLVFDFISYGYAHHVRKGVLTRYEFNDQRGKEHECNVTSEERCQFKAYKNSHTMSEFPDAFGIPEKQQEFVDSVKAQLDNCSTIQGCIADGYCTTSHSPYYTLDLAEDHAPKRTYSAAGRLECHACRAPFLFYDTLRRKAITRFDGLGCQLTTLSDALLTIHQCERRTFRFMAHVVKEVQQHHLMHLIRKNMGGDTAYLTFDFKQKFLSKGF